MRKALCFLSLALTVTIAQASAVDDLRAFLKTTQSAAGAFEQTVFVDAKEKKDASGAGNFAFMRPGRFIWHYAAPFEEKMLSDGETLWLYDVEMAQVTVKKLTTSLPASPASILFGQNNFEKDFTVSDLPDSDGQSWLKAIPKDSQSPFNEVRIAFKDRVPSGMILTDNFGQETRLTFRDVKLNPKLSIEDFRFKIPKDVDVLEDKTL